MVAREFARKLNQSIGPVKVLIPQKGWSSVDTVGNPTYDPEEDRIFVRELRALLKPEIEVMEVDANMEDPLFAEAVFKVAMAVF